jgi:hypothetical protein
MGNYCVNAYQKQVESVLALITIIAANSPFFRQASFLGF